jgi:glycosyltransferase involved in cell wall biosynthesis
MYGAFRRRGFDARIYAVDWNVQGNSDVKIWPISKIKTFLNSERDVLIYHFSMGWRTGCELIEELTCRRVIKYHNVTPPEFFAEWSEEYKNVCQSGRDQIAQIARAGCDRYLAASGYNQRELVDAGSPESRNYIVPPFTRIEELLRTQPDLEIVDKYRDGKANFLMVGTLFPHKGHPFLLEAFAAYYHDYNRECRLFIVGKESKSLVAYSRHLRELAMLFRINSAVIFSGEVDEGELKSYYLNADVFVTLSGHEGFCVPIVESMALGVPIVAFGSSAIPETVSQAGVVWPERDPYLFAETFATLVDDEALRSNLGLAGRRRYDNLFTDQKVEERLFESLAGLL